MKKGVTKLELPVVGMHHRVSISTRRMMVAHVEDETVECHLEREPQNPHDENAIRVVLATTPYEGFHIGYIDRSIAAKLAPVLDRGVTVSGCVLIEMDAVDATATVAVVLKTPVQAVKKKKRRNP